MTDFDTPPHTVQPTTGTTSSDNLGKAGIVLKQPPWAASECRGSVMWCLVSSSVEQICNWLKFDPAAQLFIRIMVYQDHDRGAGMQGGQGHELHVICTTPHATT